MGLKKRTKVSAEFSMSSLTDIIFLLLIFFMLTSSMIIPNALNLKLPGRSQSTQPPKDVPPTIVEIKSNGSTYLNGGKVTTSQLNKKVRELKRKDKKLALIITPDDNTANEHVVAVMDIAYRYGVTAILTDPK